MSLPRATHVSIEAIESPLRRAHFEGLEALRAMAAVMVVVHHVAFVAGKRHGLIGDAASVMDGGVAVFFVLSGFLIFRPFAVATLTDQPAQRTVSFWWRRILRILPAYWLVLTVLWAAGNFELGSDWWKYYLLAQPFSRDTVLGGIVPAWSLSTEISFYLLVPPFAALARRLAGTSAARLAVLVVALAAVAPIARATAPTWAGENLGLTFQWLPTNLDLFGVGMLLAVASAHAHTTGGWSDRARRATAAVWPWWVAAALVFAAYAYGVGGVGLETGYVGWFWQRRQATFAAFSLLLLIPAVVTPTRPTPLRRLWAWQPLAWVGTVSYGLYLWHLGLLERMVDRPEAVAGSADQWKGWLPYSFGSARFSVLLGATLAAGLGAAALSWYLVEKPLQRFKGAVDSVARRGRGA